MAMTRQEGEPGMAGVPQEPICEEDALALAEEKDLPRLMGWAAALRDRGYGSAVSYSRKVFIPLTQLCRDVCGYCVFARTPRKVDQPYLSVEQAVEIAARGAKVGCQEALFTLGDKPELRYGVAQQALTSMGFHSTLDYLAHVAQAVFEKTGLLPHLNPGVMTAAEMTMLRPSSISMGIMLESVSERLCERGGPHFGCPDKRPELRLASMRAAGELGIPFTTGILIGIGETRRERIESLLAIRSLHLRYGHIQEVIVQNFRAKPGTAMEHAPEPDLQDLLWTVAIARIVLGPTMNIQAPPNLSPRDEPRILAAGINDWGGVSPVTKDYVNPERPWPHLDRLAELTAASGKVLTERLAIYPSYTADLDRWVDKGLRRAVRERIDADGFVREDAWVSGGTMPLSETAVSQWIGGGIARRTSGRSLDKTLERSLAGEDLHEDEIVNLLGARGSAVAEVADAANRLRQSVNGNVVSYVVNRNINYTNVCAYRCGFCAFSKGRTAEQLRGHPYLLDLAEIASRAREAWSRGATEVCLQGGIHPQFTGDTYLQICRAVKAATPDMHIHAFSPLEISHGAGTLGLGVEPYLERLMAAGLGSLPGTAAEILDDEVRAIICPDKLGTQLWLDIIEAAHRVGLPTTATMMFGHVDRPVHWARHLMRVRQLQKRTGMITEFVPLPFVHMEAPIYLKGNARRGPTAREALLVHAVARLALHSHIANIQTSWVKMGTEGALVCLEAGANDLGGTLMNEIITRSAGAQHGEEMAPDRMQSHIQAAGRVAGQRTTLYRPAPLERQRVAATAEPLKPIINPSAKMKSDLLMADAGHGSLA
jgi:FO synthase